jgi:hypothetical protein
MLDNLTYVCPTCKTVDSTHYASQYNSTKFCDHCGSACNGYELTTRECEIAKYDAKEYSEVHKEEYDQARKDYINWR